MEKKSSHFYCYIFVLLSLVLACGNEKMPEKNLQKDYVARCMDTLNTAFQTVYDQGHLPGFAISIFTADSVFFQKGFGYANEEKQQKMNEHTVQCIASISKTLIAVCLMDAVENGHLTLDDPINDILPFTVKNPHFPHVPITIRQLATHTSSINDDGNYDRAYIFSEPLDKTKFPEAWHPYLDIYATNVPMPMADYLAKVFDEKGEWHSPENFLNEKPGTVWDYSNIAAGLLAHCIELATGEDYQTYTKELILEPLNMDRTSWSFSEVDTVNHIAYYNENRNAVPPFETLTYPDGGLFTSVHDLTKYTQEMMRGYAGKSDLLSPASYQTMMTNQVPELDSPTGLIWDLDNDCCIGHGGNDFGVATMMFFDPDTGVGKILFTNISLEKEELEDAFYGLFNTMFRYDEVLKK